MPIRAPPRHRPFLADATHCQVDEFQQRFIASERVLGLSDLVQTQWALQTAERIGHNKAAVALANKLVRICWAVWCHERRFSGDWQSARPA
jgi:hypothetical protein